MSDTVYITSRDYGRYLQEAVESVLRQSFRQWELWIVDDGSRDGTLEIANRFADSDERIRVMVNEQPRGLRHCANAVLEQARGRYIIRLDADDYFDESALLVLSDHLDQHPDVGLVFPNWTYVDEHGEFLGVENRKKIGTESKVLDLPAHGACTMVRKRVLKSVGGYDTQHDSQDGHELWIKVLHRHGVANVSTPLFFYRQHDSSMSRDESRLLAARQRIKRSLAQRNAGTVKPRIVGIIPAKNTYAHLPNVVLETIGGKPLIQHTLDQAIATTSMDQVFVFTDDAKVCDYCRDQPRVLAELRDADLSDQRSTLAQVMASAVNRLEQQHEIYPDIVILLSVHAPLRRACHIQEAIDTLLHYDVETVISTYEDHELHFSHGTNGLAALNPGMFKQLRFEREALFVDNGAVYATWRECIEQDELYKGRLGHVVMPRSLSFQIKSAADKRLIAHCLDSESET
ncbi:MAG: glycosyltransferase family 2 protein [Planctomycetota bacterium]